MYHKLLYNCKLAVKQLKFPLPIVIVSVTKFVPLLVVFISDVPAAYPIAEGDASHQIEAELVNGFVCNTFHDAPLFDE